MATDRQRDCLDENDALDFIQGRTDSARTKEIERHIDGCTPCRWLLSAMARATSVAVAPSAGADRSSPADGGLTSDPGERPTSAGESIGDSEGAADGARVRLLRPGQQLGRYTISGFRGIGSMGVVYEARDVELDRSIALKVLRFDPGARSTGEGSHGDGGRGPGDTARARLVREAQALARLSHPNVVAIHDVGAHDQEVFAAMELVEGATLDDWLRAAPRSPSEIIEVMAGAGRGLAAAHAAGLIHRDVKPENILVGLDGRARMTDFGLVGVIAFADGSGDFGSKAEGATGRPAASDTPSPAAHDATSRAAHDAGASLTQLTRTGMLLGTPAYMSPEQLRAQAVGPAADQFSFAVTLYEALYGERPFLGKSLAELRERVLAGGVEVPRRAGVPRRIRRALRRALEPDPEQRYPSIDALLADLVGDGGRRRALWVGGGAVAIAIAAVAALSIGRGGEPPCTGAERKLDGVWDPIRRNTVQRAFIMSGAPAAGDVFERLAHGLDAYTGEWVAMHTDACEATAVRAEQADDVLTLRMACLAKDLALTEQLVDLFASPSFGRLGQAASAVAALPPLAACSDVAALKAVAPLPTDPAMRARLAALEARVAELKARWLVDDVAAVRQGAPALIAEAKAIGHAPTTAAALMLAGDVERTFGQLRAAEDLLYQALWAAEAARDEGQVATAWIALAGVVGRDQKRFPEGDRLLRNAEQAVDRVVAISPAAGHPLRIRLLGTAAGLQLAEGNTAEALTRSGEALDLETQHFGGDTVMASQLHHMRASFKMVGGDPAGAQIEIQRALAIAEQRLGVGPRVIKYHGIAAGILQAQSKLDEAIAENERVLALAAQVFDTDNLDVALATGSLGVVYQRKGDLDRAQRLLERTVAILTKVRGERSAEVSKALYFLGANEASRGHRSLARAHFERALAISEQVEGPMHNNLADRLIALGEVLVDDGEQDRAIQMFERGVNILETRRARGQGGYPALLANAQFQLGKALWSRPRDRPRARALMKSARELLKGLSKDVWAQSIIGEMARWTAAHAH